MNKGILIGFAAGIVCLFFLVRAIIRKERLSDWMIYYGTELTAPDLRGKTLAILEPENISPKTLTATGKIKFVGYLSVGEINESRSYWQAIKEKPFVLKSNPDWPGAHRVDIRAAQWRQLLLETIIPEILAKGYQGLFLDTVDTAEYLEETDPQRFAGSKEAMLQFVHSIREKFPSILILPNNGFALLDGWKEIVDGVVVEDLYTRYDFASKTIGETPLAVSRDKEGHLDRFREATGKPVYNILYASPESGSITQEAIRHSRQKSYHWFVTDIALRTK
ncbi:MAG: endo alpha-1,4 polygalactosaminidase [Deltaproteobacteria bacterium]|nr:endo alpha-1,4 polygalactosaminidase [Deltaproteobacteria bacterium]